MRTPQFTLGLSAAVLVAGAVAVTAQDNSYPRPKKLSELPLPRVGDRVKFARAEILTKPDIDGVQDVTWVIEAVPGTADEKPIPSTHWQLDLDGWFDSEGFNITTVYPRSGLWAMRIAPDVRGAARADRPLTHPAGTGDIITHIDGIAVTSYDKFVYAINRAPDKRELPVVLLDGSTGKKRLLYVTCSKYATP
jgi:hypothetical protein